MRKQLLFSFDALKQAEKKNQELSSTLDEKEREIQNKLQEQGKIKNELNKWIEEMK